MSNAVDTSKVADHRKLRFKDIDELLGEIERIVAADSAGTLRRTGNWSAGQMFGHLASWINYGYEGFPKEARPPWFIRPLVRRLKKKFLSEGMPRGVRIPRAVEGT
jgi:hypothetical protein